MSRSAVAVALWVLLASCAQRATPNVPGDGDYFSAGDGARLWFKVAGNTRGPALVFLHGGPGYNAYAFERAVGKRLERTFRVVYFDQRGAGRSCGVTHGLGSAHEADDLEALRTHLGVDRWIVLGHSYGGVVALRYHRKHSNPIAGLILVDTTPDLYAAISHQVSQLARFAPEAFPDAAAQLERNASSNATPFEKLLAAYGILGRDRVQRALHYASDEGQARNDGWDEQSGLMSCGGAVAAAYRAEGAFESRGSELLSPIDVPALVLAGRQSHVVGEPSITEAARSWGRPVQWFANSGHFPYVEEPEAFVTAVEKFAAALHARK